MMASKKILAAIAATLLVGASIALVAQDRSTPQARRGTAENGLIGINLFDTGARVIAKFGNPDEIQALTIGNTGIGPAGGAGGGTGPGGAGARGAGGGGGGGARTPTLTEGFMPELPPSIIGDPFAGGVSRQNAPGQDGELQLRGGTGGGGGAAPASAGGGAGGTGEGGLVTYTRWIYRKGSSRYAFVLDKFNRVVQIEAVGLSDGRVRTKRGVSFGSTFGTLINRYNAPDGYEISGTNMVVRYLTRDRVAFRMQKVDAKKPHVVTGIVVAAGR
jgi:hypothetical protein